MATKTKTSPVPRKKLSSVDPTNSLGILASAICYAKCFADGCDVHRNLVYISLLKVAQGGVLEYIMYNAQLMLIRLFVRCPVSLPEDLICFVSLCSHPAREHTFRNQCPSLFSRRVVSLPGDLTYIKRTLTSN